MPKSAEQNQRILDERREQIVASALGVFSLKGLAATKISDIAKSASISQGLLYHYFKSKEEIFTELIRSAFERMIFAATELSALPLPAHQKIKTAVTALLQDIETKEAFTQYVLLIAQAGISDAVPREVKEILLTKSHIPYEVMENIFADGKREGTVKDYDPGEMATLFWTTIKGLALHKATFGNKYNSPNPRMLLELFLMPRQDAPSGKESKGEVNGRVSSA